MSYFSDLAFCRRSIRKFEEKDIPLKEICEFIKIASSAPSACNSQCWKFVAIKSKTKINQIKGAVIEKYNKILSIKNNELSESYLSSKTKMVSFFSKAPLVVAVFLTKLEFYDSVFISALKDHGYNYDDINKLLGYPDLLSIGAAVQNLLLAVHEKGYGACWMNDPVIAGNEINKILDIPEDNKFICLIPIGLPAYSPREKKVKDLDDVFTIL